MSQPTTMIYKNGSFFFILKITIAEHRAIMELLIQKCNFVSEIKVLFEIGILAIKWKFFIKTIRP